MRECVCVWVSVGRSRSPMSKCSKVGVDGGKVRTSWDGDEKPGTQDGSGRGVGLEVRVSDRGRRESGLERHVVQLPRLSLLLENL